LGAYRCLEVVAHIAPFGDGCHSAPGNPGFVGSAFSGWCGYQLYIHIQKRAYAGMETRAHPYTHTKTYISCIHMQTHIRTPTYRY